MKKLFIILSLSTFITMSIAMDDVTSNENEGFKGKQSVISEELEKKLSSMCQLLNITDQEKWRATPKMSYTNVKEPTIDFLQNTLFDDKWKDVPQFELQVKFEPLKTEKVRFVTLGVKFFQNSRTAKEYHIECEYWWGMVNHYNGARMGFFNIAKKQELTRDALLTEGKSSLPAKLSEQHFDKFLETFDAIDKSLQEEQVWNLVTIDTPCVHEDLPIKEEKSLFGKCYEWVMSHFA